MTTATMMKGGANVHLNDKNYVCTTKSRLSQLYSISEKVCALLKLDDICVSH